LGLKIKVPKNIKGKHPGQETEAICQKESLRERRHKDSGIKLK
jgi:hypothetical protein